MVVALGRIPGTRALVVHGGGEGVLVHDGAALDGAAQARGGGLAALLGLGAAVLHRAPPAPRAP